jgi:methylated-DNA-protein-cysteine methyltransferase-like protein
MNDQADSIGGASLYERIFACVRQVPSGRVTTYGAIGHIVGCPARVVGYALHHLGRMDRPETPWQRVINAQGRISTYGAEQRAILESEGVVFDDQGRTDFERFGWPEELAARSKRAPRRRSAARQDQPWDER